MDIVSVRLVRYAENTRRAVQRFSLSRSSAFVDIITPVFEHPEVLPDSNGNKETTTVSHHRDTVVRYKCISLDFI